MWDLLTNRVTVRRRTSLLLERTSAASTMAWTRQPVREALVEVRIWPDGTTGSGEVTIAGTSGGALATETLVATGPAYLRTSRGWTALAGLTTSGLADEAAVPTVEARAVGRDGTATEGPYTLKVGWPAAVMPGGSAGSLQAGGSWPSDRRLGRAEAADATILVAFDETWTPQAGDLLTDEMGQTWELQGVPRLASALMGPHWNCRARRHELGD